MTNYIYFATRQQARESAVAGKVIDFGADAEKGKRWAKEIAVEQTCNDVDNAPANSPVANLSTTIKRATITLANCVKKPLSEKIADYLAKHGQARYNQENDVNFLAGLYNSNLKQGGNYVLCKTMA